MPIEPLNSRRLLNLAAIAAIAFALGCARGIPVRDDRAAPVPTARLELQGNVIRFGDATLRFRDRLETWTQVLGLPSRSKGTHHFWFGNSLEVVASQTVDGRAYVDALVGRLGDDALPGGLVLQGVHLFHGAPSFPSVMRALAATETPLAGLGHDKLFEAASMKATRPDGFVVSVRATLDCLPHLAPGSTGTCEQVIDELEIRADWQ